MVVVGVVDEDDTRWEDDIESVSSSLAAAGCSWAAGSAYAGSASAIVYFVGGVFYDNQINL